MRGELWGWKALGMSRVCWWVGVLVFVCGAGGVRGGTWDEWRGPRADATVSAEFVSGWAVEPSKEFRQKAVPNNRGYDGELVLTLKEGAPVPPGPLSVVMWHAGVADELMNWPKEGEKMDRDSFVLDILPEVKIGPVALEERWELSSAFPLRVPVVRPRSVEIADNWRFNYWSALWGGLELWVYLACFGLNVLAGLTLSTLALGLSGLFGRSLSAYLAAGAVLFLWCLALPMFGGLTFGILGTDATLTTTQIIWGGFFFHHPLAPQIGMTMRGSGEAIVFQNWGWWVPAVSVVVWLLLNLLGDALAVRGLRREVY